jgi:2-oxoglutarate ferredoxin oxidoreductase subunit alpha
VLAATSVGDCYELAQTAFEIAERYQTPVIVLLDQYLGQNHQTLESFAPRIVAPPALVGAEPTGSQWRRRAEPTDLAAGYARYLLDGPDGVSASSLPGQPGGEFTAVGIEHAPDGDVTSSPAMHQAMSAKRAAKLQAAARDYPLLSRWDPPLAAESRPLSLLTWGSSYGVCEEAAVRLSAAGVPTRVLAPRLLYPLPLEPLAQWLSGCGELAVLETNFSGQFYHHLRAQLELPQGTQAYHRAGGMPLMLGEVLDWLQGRFDVSNPISTELSEVLAR